jgi:hypothetical protein
MKEGTAFLRVQVYCDATVYSDSVLVMVRSPMRPGFPIHLPGYAGISPAVSDIDGDGLKEIVVTCQKGVFAYNQDGSLLPGFPVLVDHDMRSMPAIDDVDGDGLMDIIVTGESIVGCYNYLGQALPGWPKEASTGMTFATFPVPVATELFDREDSVVVYISKYGEVRAYKYNGDSYFYSLDGWY